MPLSLFPFVPNLLGLILFGTLVLGWLLRYTDLFPLVGGLLGLGGVFAWIAFLSGIVREERKQQLQQAFESCYLGRLRSLLITAAALVLFCFGIALRHGTVELDATLDPAGRRVEIVELAGVDGGKRRSHGRIALPARSAARVLLPATLLATRTFELRPDGLPARRLSLRPLQRQTVSVPDSFYERPIYVVRVDTRWLQKIRTFADFHLEIAIRDGPGAAQTQRIDPFEGRPAWIGARAGVTAPDRFLDRWRADLIGAGQPPDVAATWREPWGGELNPQPGQTLEVTLVQVRRAPGLPDERTEWARASQRVDATGPFPREIRLPWKERSDDDAQGP